MLLLVLLLLPPPFAAAAQKALEKSEEERELIDEMKPHPQHLCEKCKQLGYYCGDK